jgi:lysophospholipase L1-like esterase
VGLLRRLAAWAGAASATGAACAAHAVAPAPAGVERVVFVGDSLVNRSDKDHGLLRLVRSALERSHPGAALDLVNAGNNGDCIADIHSRLADDVLALRPAAVVLYWDSDAVDVEGAAESRDRSRALRADYRRNLARVLADLRGVTPNVVVAGPTLLGERPRGQNPKDHVLDAYERINRRVCHAHHVTWVDTRRAAFAWLSEHGPSPSRDSGSLTEDGEHLNAAGTELVAAEIAVALGRWLSGQPAAVPELEEAMHRSFATPRERRSE